LNFKNLIEGSTKIFLKDNDASYANIVILFLYFFGGYSVYKIALIVSYTWLVLIVLILRIGKN
jgi:hypothetical protein